MPSGGGNKNQTVTEKNEPWEEAAPYILAALESYQELFESDPDGELIIEERDENTILAEDTVLSRVGSETYNMAGKLAPAAVIEILSRGTYARIDEVFASIESRVNSSVSAQFGAANRIGGALYQQAISEGLTNEFAIPATQIYQNESSQKLNAAQIASASDEAANSDVKMLASVGTDREAYAQRKISAPYIQKSRWLDAVGTAGGFGGTSQRTHDGGERGRNSALGGALSGAATGFMTGGPFGALIGAGMGLLG